MPYVELKQLLEQLKNDNAAKWISVRVLTGATTCLCLSCVVFFLLWSTIYTQTAIWDLSSYNNNHQIPPTNDIRN